MTNANAGAGRAEVVVDLDAIAANTAVLRERVGRPLMAVVKADGYGHGAVDVARAALDAGATWLGVCTLEEALDLRGLMAIAPLAGDADRWMSELARIQHDFTARFPDARVLSAGMSGDLEVAVAHGSTCVRVGTAIMGERPLLSQ